MPIDSNDELDLESDFESPPPRPAKKTRPQVEGINSPKASREVVKVKTAFKGAEEFKPTESKLMPDRVSTRKGGGARGGKIFWIILIILILLALGDWLFGNYLPASLDFFSHGNVPTTTNNDQPSPVPTLQDQPTAMPTPATTTIDSLIPSASSTPATSTPVTAPVSGKQLKINDTGTGFLNVRSQPSTASALITKVHPGETYVYVAQKSGWYQIALPGDKTGWVAGQYVSVVK